MEAWLIYNREDAARNSRNIDFYFAACRQRKVHLQLMFEEDIVLEVREGRLVIHAGGSLPSLPDFAVCRTINPMLSEHLEAVGVPVYNNAFVSRICNNKMHAYRYLSQHGIPCMDTVYVSSPEQAANRMEYPFVLKQVDGRGGTGVFLIKNHEELDKAAAAIGPSGCVAQAMASDTGRDLRVYVIGKKIIGAMLRISKTDFRSNFSLGGEVEQYTLSKEEAALVHRIIDLFDFGFVGIDFVFHEGRMVFNEIEDVVGARMLYQFSDVQPVPLYIDYILSSLHKKVQ